MKMPDRIETNMLAPCGIDCTVCYAHVGMRKSGQCPGCMQDGAGKPNHCEKCRIKACVGEKGLTHCYSCPDFPCKLIKSLERSYNKRYNVSLVANSEAAREDGAEAFLERDRARWTCRDCGGAFSLHDNVCSDCGGKTRG